MSSTFLEQEIIDSKLTNFESINWELESMNSPIVKDDTNIQGTSSNFVNLDSRVQDSMIAWKYDNNTSFESDWYRRNYSITLQSWKGVVLNLNNNSFLAELEDLTGGALKNMQSLNFLIFLKMINL